MSIEYIPDDETRLDTKDVWIEELQERIKQLEEAKKRALVIIIESKQLEEYIEKLENEIKGYLGQHDSTDQ